MDNWITRFRAAKTIDGQPAVVIPGDPEREYESIRMNEGIPLNEKVVQDLKEVGAKMNVALKQ
jgi:LDH2 family malate/lactate/ureidoglycolate dehydrogenase